MSRRFCIPILMTFSVAFSQSQANLSGTVRKSDATSPVSGATVSLQRLALTTVTDPDGRFTLMGASGTSRSPTRQETSRPGTIQYWQEAEGNVVIRVRDLRGVQRAIIYSGSLSRGFWSIVAPPLPQEVYLCDVESPTSHHMIRFLGSERAEGSRVVAPSLARTTSEGSDLAGRSSAALPIDTLVVAKVGYQTTRLPLASYVQSGMEIVLEDSGSTSIDKVQNSVESGQSIRLKAATLIRLNPAT